ELAAGNSQGIGGDGHVEGQLVQGSVANIAHPAGIVVERQKVDHVGDLVVAQADADDAFAPEPLLERQLADPALLRLQVDVAAENVVVGQFGRGGEVVEVQLPDRPFQAQAKL